MTQVLKVLVTVENCKASLLEECRVTAGWYFILKGLELSVNCSWRLFDEESDRGRGINRSTQGKQHNDELIKAEERQEMSRNVTIHGYLLLHFSGSWLRSVCQHSHSSAWHLLVHASLKVYHLNAAIFACGCLISDTMCLSQTPLSDKLCMCPNIYLFVSSFACIFIYKIYLFRCIYLLFIYI